MIATRRANAALFVKLFGDDHRFIIQRENGQSSWFSFTMILNPAAGMDRALLMETLRSANIEFRMITGGCFPQHEAIKYFDYDIVGGIESATIAHTRGFFVGNHPRDLTPEITRLRDVLQ
jgi:CDP-6-deoxy-D-xylo-4-hexulose-3-dehydrase